jgi:periplasmic copper chaperone A
MRKSKLCQGALGLLGAAALLAPASAGAHVTVQPGQQPAGEFFKFGVRVPTERDNASTTQIRVQMPPGWYFLNYEPRAGWDISIVKEKLDPPVEQFGEEVTEQVKELRIKAAAGNKGIEPGQFEEFFFSGGPVPGKPGTDVKYKAIQTYSSGEVVRWIDEDPEAESPASTVTAIDAEATDPVRLASAVTDQSAGSEDESDDDFASKGLGIAALIAGVLGLLLGLVALLRRRTA